MKISSDTKGIFFCLNILFNDLFAIGRKADTRQWMQNMLRLLRRPVVAL